MRTFGPVRSAAAALLVAAVAALAGTPASAAEPEILVSDDGVTFAPTLDTGLFDDLGLLIPLGSIDSSLWVRNTSTTDGSLRLSVAEFESDSEEFRDSLTITAVAPTGEWTWTVANPSVCATVVPSLPIGAGDTVRIDLSAALADVSGQDVQDETAHISFGVGVRDASSPYPANPCANPGTGGPGGEEPGGTDPGDGTDGSLSGTGADVIPLVAISLALLVSGFVVLAARRRRDEETA